MLTMQKISALQPLAAWTDRWCVSPGPGFTRILSAEWLAEVSAPVSLSRASYSGRLSRGRDLQTQGTEQEDNTGPLATRRGHTLKSQGLGGRALLNPTLSPSNIS